MFVCWKTFIDLTYMYIEDIVCVLQKNVTSYMRYSDGQFNDTRWRRSSEKIERKSVEFSLSICLKCHFLRSFFVDCIFFFFRTSHFHQWWVIRTFFSTNWPLYSSIWIWKQFKSMETSLIFHTNKQVWYFNSIPGRVSALNRQFISV